MGGKIAFAEKPVAQAKNQTFIGTFIETDFASKEIHRKSGIQRVCCIAAFL